MDAGGWPVQPGRRTEGPEPTAGRTGEPVGLGELATNDPFPGRRARDGRDALLPWRRFFLLRRGPSPSTSASELQPYDPVSRRRCKIRYRMTAAVAATLSESSRPRTGRLTRSSQAAATRGRSPRPSAPSTTTTFPRKSGPVYGVRASAAAP